jgi:predicted dehydrogenase
MSEQILRGGIIGCGFFAQFQIHAWRRMPSVNLTAACDLDIQRARAAAPQAYTSAEEMLDREDLDFVDIATRPETHLPLVRLAVSRGIPAICQKPLAPTWREALAVASAAGSAGIRVMVHENWRWQPWYREAKRLIDTGAIGIPLTYRFRTVKRDGAGPQPYPDQPYFRGYPRLLIYETIVHHLDTARFFFGDVLHLYAQARRNNPLIQGEDQAHLLLTHDSGLIGGIDGHRFLEPAQPGPVMGEASFEGDSGALYVLPSGDLRMDSETVWRNNTGQGYRGDSVLATQQHFIDCLRTGKPFESELGEYLKTSALVEAAYRSIQTGCAVAPVSVC